MSISPCGHRLTVKPFKQAEVDEVMKAATDSGFLQSFKIINSNEKREDASVDRGIVLEIGPTAWQNESHGFKPWCKKGDEILFAKFAGKFVTDPETGEDVCVLNDEDVVAVIKEAQ